MERLQIREVPRPGSSWTFAVAALLGCTALTAPALAQSTTSGATATAPDTPSTVTGSTATSTPPAPSKAATTDASGAIVITGSLGALPLKDVGSVFGFDKTLVETPRSASTVSAQ